MTTTVTKNLIDTRLNDLLSLGWSHFNSLAANDAVPASQVEMAHELYSELKDIIDDLAKELA